MKIRAFLTSMRSWAVVATLALAVVATAMLPGSATEAGQGLEIVGVQVVGSLVLVTVHNASGSALSGTVYADVVLVTGESASGESPVNLQSGETGTLSLGFPAPVQSLQSVGIHDDVDPF